MTERILAIPMIDLASIFDEWQKRYLEQPDAFAEIEGVGYGKACAEYFSKLALEFNGRELDVGSS